MERGGNISRKNIALYSLQKGYLKEWWDINKPLFQIYTF